ncbi:MAG: hypothetical protein OSA48_00630 [Akkermansiaceae bacterium]|nr:hypothetical protein [Akkermansiaceae bacterium]
MTNKRQTDPQSLRGRWRSLGQLCEMWGLSRERTRLVVDALVRSERMEVRHLPAPEEHKILYRAVSKD